ncbi:hypothetical protein RDV84_12990 [Lysobacter yananisis]|uniref:Uncharacterized protein n=1 Tax=Lysobacter yananisis TaxID=1003114 RepID=A0ABY9PG46_9GAMM|nr:hypothetical protein [Lysobacter yananisis]WMT05715.1 hypothetical protein RDV84_12990 [Lysobacter yananisis]
MAAKRKPITVADHDRLFFTRWVLFLLVANEAAGLPEVSRERLHALLFMSFASSRYYAIDPLRQRARRTPQGPYYRQAHVALGGLVMGGMVSVGDFKAHPALRDLQFEGYFRPTLKGLEVARIMRETITGARLYRFLLDMCLAAASATQHVGVMAQAESALDSILSADLTYRRALKRLGDSLELQEVPGERTPTVEGLSTIQERLDQQGAYNRRDVVAAYQSLLLRRSAQVA